MTHPVHMYFQEGKRVGPAGDNSSRFSRLYVMDKTTGTRYLIDTGSNVSVYSPQKRGRQRENRNIQFYTTDQR